MLLKPEYLTITFATYEALPMCQLWAMATPRDGNCYNLHCIKGKKNGGSERKVASPRSHSQRVVELGFDLKFSATVLLCLREVVLGFPGGVVVKNPSANAGGHGFVPWSRKIPHAAEQLNLCATTTEPAL